MQIKSLDYIIHISNFPSFCFNLISVKMGAPRLLKAGVQHVYIHNCI